MKQRDKEINDFLKSHQGLAYLSMKYPKLSVKEAIREYKLNASK
jgi:hypothetical protein